MSDTQGDLSPMLKTSEVAAMLAKTTRWVSGAAAAGQIGGAYRIGGEWRFDFAEFRSWVVAQRRTPSPKTNRHSDIGLGTRDRATRKRLADIYGL